MDYFEIGVYGVMFGLNVLFGWLGMKWMQRKGYAETAWVILVLSLVIGFVLPLLVVSFLPGRRHPAPRRNLQRRALPAANLPQPRKQNAS